MCFGCFVCVWFKIVAFGVNGWLVGLLLSGLLGALACVGWWVLWLTAWGDDLVCMVVLLGTGRVVGG